MKTMFLVILSITLSGCVYQQVDLVDIERAMEYCKSENSDVYKIASRFDGYTIVNCKNGKRKTFD